VESTPTEPVIPLLADALTVLMQSLIQEAQVMRELAEEPGATPIDHATYMTTFRQKSNLAYRVSLLVDQYRKGKLA
jgi:hypothetical protein